MYAQQYKAMQHYQDQPVATNCENWSFTSWYGRSVAVQKRRFEYPKSFLFALHLTPKVRRNVLAEMVRISRRKLAVSVYFNRPTPLLLLNRLLSRTNSLPRPASARQTSLRNSKF